MDITRTTVRQILTRTGGYLADVASHSLQPYRGCTYGNSLCGVGCYVRHLPFVLRGRKWGGFLEVRTNAAESYRKSYASEAAWARKSGPFSIFCSSSTDPFVPQERAEGITRSLLEAMCEQPPDRLILQTHSHRAVDALQVCCKLHQRCELRLHMSIESDRDRLPGLPPPASPVARRVETCRAFRDAGIPVIVTVAPLLPIEHPERFFERIAAVADGVVLDHYIGGDGSPLGARTLRTSLPAAMAKVDPDSLRLEYRDRMAAVAERYLPGRVGVGAAGFAGRWQTRPVIAD